MAKFHLKKDWRITVLNTKIQGAQYLIETFRKAQTKPCNMRVTELWSLAVNVEIIGTHWCLPLVPVFTFAINILKYWYWNREQRQYFRINIVLISTDAHEKEWVMMFSDLKITCTEHLPVRAWRHTDCNCCRCWRNCSVIEHVNCKLF